MPQNYLLFTKSQTQIRTFFPNEHHILYNLDADEFYTNAPIHSAERLAEHLSEIVFPNVEEFETDENEQQRDFLVDVFSRYLEAIYTVGKSLAEEKEELESSVSRMENDYEDLYEEHCSLKELESALYTENDELKEENQTLKNRIDELKEILYDG